MAEDQEQVDTAAYLLVEAFEVLKEAKRKWAPNTTNSKADDLIRDIDEYLNSLPRDKS